MRDYEPYYTEDGSIGLYSYSDKDVYHSKFGALTEAWEKFIIPSGIDKLMETKQDINVLDVCYGIGYNTKALMSHVINNNISILTKKTIIQKLANFVSVYTNKILPKKISRLFSCNDTIYENNPLPHIKIDCLDINEELVKLSPLFITIKTPGEYYYEFVPKFLSCFDSYYTFKNIYENIASIFYPKNRKEITELLNLKFKSMHIDNEYKVNKLVNYLLIDKMSRIYHQNYIDDELKKILTSKDISKFFDKSMIKYAKFNRILGYNLLSQLKISTFLHNIYYATLSKRYKNADIKAIKKLFSLNFFINDARKSIKSINDKYDFIFLDAFSYTKAPQLWSLEFISELNNRLADGGIIITYSCSAQIRNTFIENNLYVGKIYNKKENKFVGTIASNDKSKIEYPLNNYEIGLCNTKAGIPYHDPNLVFSNKEILELREFEFRHSNLMSSSKYMKLHNL